MNLLTKIIFVCLIFQLNISAQDCKARIILLTDADESVFFIDSILTCKGDSFMVELNPGTYTIRIVKNLDQWNSEKIVDTLIIANCSDMILNYNFADKSLLDTNPQDVYVVEGDSLLGFTPLLLEKNFSTLNLRKPDYAEKLVTHQELTSGQIPELEFIGEERRESFYNTTLFKLLVGTAVALGAVTAYYKLEADQSFDEYQLTGDPESLEKTDQYDIISGITFVVLQIDFALIIYFFMSN